MKDSNSVRKCGWLLMGGALLFGSGCVATQDWVQTYVKEQIFPVDKRVSETEANMTKMDGRVSGLEGQVQTMSSQIAAMNSKLNQTDAKADRALENLQKLKVERKLVLDLQRGAFFKTNSTVLSPQAKSDIDSFLSDLSGQAGGLSGLLFVVTGHTDNTGSAKYNYDLALLRAQNAASYLTTQKKIDPGQLIVMSYGETIPVADNRTEEGRAKNRRIEILVYKDTVSVESGRQAAAAAR